MCPSGSFVFLAVASIVVICGPSVTFACDGYVYEEEYLRPKAGNEMILTEHKSPVLTDKCTFKLHGCMEIAHDIKGPIQIDWNITKDGSQQLVGHEDDLCEGFGRMSEEDKTFLAALGIPLECPIPKGKICKKNEEVSVEHYRGSLPMMEGTAAGSIKITTATGRSEFEFSGKLSKADRK